MAFCVNCGSRIPEDTVFCTSCGKAVQTGTNSDAAPVMAVPVQPATTVQGKKIPLAAILAAAGVAVALVIIIAVSSNNRPVQPSAPTPSSGGTTTQPQSPAPAQTQTTIIDSRPEKQNNLKR